MELADKIKKLEEEFKGLPKILIKRTLCGEDVDGDLTKARQRLQEFKQMTNPSLNNPMPANPVTEELRGGLQAPHCSEEGKIQRENYTQ